MAGYNLGQAYIQIMPTAKGITGEISSILGAEGEKGASSIGSKFTKGLKAVGTAAASALVAGTGAMVAFTKSAVEAGMNFDSSMSQVAATMGVSMDQLNSDIQTVTLATGEWTGSLRDFAKKMGSETKFSATEAADALNYMALAGYDTKTSMEMLPNVLSLAAAGNMDLARASDMVTDTQSALGLTLEETNTMVDQMAKTSSKSNTSVEQLGDAMLKIGATARNVKGGTAELSTVLGVLADNGIKGSEGGTHLRNMLLSLQQAAENGSVSFGDFAVEVYDADGNMRSMIDIVADMQEGMGGLSQEARDAMISGVFNKTDLASVNALLGTSQERFSELTTEIANCAGAAKEMEDTQLKNLQGDITILKSAFEGLQIAISDGATPALRTVVKGMTEVVNGLNDMISGVDGGAKRVKDGFSQMLKGISDVVPQVLQMFSALLTSLLELLPDFAKQIISVLPSIFDQIMSSIAVLIPGIAKLLPDIINAVVKMIVSIVGHLSDIIKPIIQAMPTIIKGIIQAIIQNIPAIIQGILEVIITIVSELPNMCMEIIEYIPQLFAQLVVAIVKCIPMILSAIGELVEKIVFSLFGLEDPIEQVGMKMGELGQAARDGWSEVSEAFNQELDCSGILSSLGNTSSEIQAQIDSLEGEITNIIATRLREQQGLRAEDIENIKNYQEQIRQLEEEKMGIYGSQASAQLEIMKGLTGATAEEYAQRFAMLQSANEQERASLETYYQQQYVDAQNQHNLMKEEAARYLAENGGIQDAHYQQMLADAQAVYDSDIAAADAYYTEKNQIISDREAEALNIMANANGSFISGTVSTFDQATGAAQAWQTTSGEVMSAYCSDAQVAQAAAQVSFSQLANNLSATDAKNAAAWLSMAAKARSGGASLSGAAKDNAASILNAFQNVPSDLEDDAHQMIMGMAAGLEGEIPALQHSSKMTAEEIANAIKDYLQIRSPSRLMKGFGENTVAGLTEGIESKGSSAAGAMRSVGENLIRGVGYGMQSMTGWLSNIAANAVTSAVNAAKRAGAIRSPSRIMRDEVGAMLGEGLAIGLEDSEPHILDAVDDIGEHMKKAVNDYDLYTNIVEGTISASDHATRDMAVTADLNGNRLRAQVSDAAPGNEEDTQEILLGIAELLKQHFPELIEKSDKKIVLDSGALVGELTADIDNSLGHRQVLKERGTYAYV